MLAVFSYFALGWVGLGLPSSLFSCNIYLFSNPTAFNRIGCIVSTIPRYWVIGWLALAVGTEVGRRWCCAVWLIDLGVFCWLIWVVAVYLTLLGRKTYKYSYEADELPNPRPNPTQEKLGWKWHSKWFFRGLGLILYMKQTTRNPTRPNHILRQQPYWFNCWLIDWCVDG